MFDNSDFLGMDGGLIEGNGGFGTGFTVCQLVPSRLIKQTGLPDVSKGILGYTRSDIYVIRSPMPGLTAFLAQFDGPGIEAVPDQRAGRC